MAVYWVRCIRHGEVFKEGRILYASKLDISSSPFQSDSFPLSTIMDIKKDGVTHVDDLDNEFRDAKFAVQLSEEAVYIKQSPWTSSMWKLYGCLAIAYLCGCLNGYDGSLMVSLYPCILLVLLLLPCVSSSPERACSGQDLLRLQITQF
jgi:hypothetical protein